MNQTNGIWLPDGDDHFAQHLAAGPMIGGKGTYQHRKYAAALRHVRHRGHAVDVGGHVGLWSRVMALDFERVTAFEPVACLRDCYMRNVTEGAVDLLPYAVGAQEGTARIAMPNGNSGNACLSADGEECRMVALDDMSLDGIDLLKIDVEGCERDVVLGAEQTIRRDRPVMVVEQKPGNAERYGAGQWDAVALLGKWGMKQAEVISGDHIMVWPCSRS